MFTLLVPRKPTLFSPLFRHDSIRLLTTQATFYYLKDLPEYKTTKPYHINVPSWALPPGQQCNEVSVALSNIPVTGLRSQLHHFTLDRNGFQVEREDERGPRSLFDCISPGEYDEANKVKDRVRPAVESFLKRKIPGAEDVIAFSSQVRRRDPQFPALPRGSDPTKPQPVQGVHVDFAPDSARTELVEVLAARGYSNLAGRRWQIISIWKPLFGPLKDWPLGLLDYTSMDTERDLVASDNIYPHVIRETYNVLFNERHKWYYLENQQADEVLVFKGFDTHATRGHARVCPHAAFADPLAPATARPRESFECQSVVIYPEGSAASNTYEEVYHF
ncbi:hypothetical protein AJ80_07831 [Polytolypa hystricis UAMH7299]|uniref:Uncharacterized protein n=1 Tax=Polytolypa hystricis (strain UAMH7299) TaxID=1447883 RepID=A0A2B7XIA8_POLH7|nr:hypothetical protein AJ80_07831 [Polytolypa hystricis UAMH7299]